MIDRQLTEIGGNWREKSAELETLLEQVRPQLIEAEAELAERLAVISAFEFKLRARLEPLTRRLEKLQTEIQEYRQKLRHLRENQANNEEEPNSWASSEEWDFAAETAAASGAYRYREAPTEPPPPALSQDDAGALKQAYRRLARRFHPDLALDDADRAYRTGIMKAINAAYTAGDLAQLQKLAQEPDSASRIEYARTDRQRVHALYVELIRCHRRLAEIKEELTRLEQHQSARLLRRSERAAANGHDWLMEMSLDLKNEIAHKMIERDVLKQQITQFGREELDFGGDAFADAVLDLDYEGVFDDDAATITARWNTHANWDGDILDDSD